jgi:hypothetical protein
MQTAEIQASADGQLSKNSYNMSLIRRKYHVSAAETYVTSVTDNIVIVEHRYNQSHATLLKTKTERKGMPRTARVNKFQRRDTKVKKYTNEFTLLFGFHL